MTEFVYSPETGQLQLLTNDKVIATKQLALYLSEEEVLAILIKAWNE